MKRSMLVAVIAVALSSTLLVSLVSASPSPPNPVPPPAGYTMPAEWDAHVATWLSWGHRWQEETIRDLQIQIMDILQEGEEVHVIVDSAQQEAAVKRMMRMAGVPPDNVFIHIILADDIWIRDFGPTWIDDGTTQAIVDWLFDGWGEQSLSWDDNDEVPREIADLLGQDFYSYMDYVVEGGAIDV
ncbi:MAG: agmatine deiminase family protein, partial [Candidatus Bathyarchaeia archaeon]